VFDGIRAEESNILLALFLGTTLDLVRHAERVERDWREEFGNLATAELRRASTSIAKRAGR
jgi:hypothetical protein